MSTTIRVHHAVRPASKPEDYILVQPDSLPEGKCRAVRIVKCPYGPLVQWAERDDVECPFCDGAGDLEVRGKNGDYKEVDCPECAGVGVSWEYSANPIWSDADGNIVEPEFITHNDERQTISERWIKEWVASRQAH